MATQRESYADQILRALARGLETSDYREVSESTASISSGVIKTLIPSTAAVFLSSGAPLIAMHESPIGAPDEATDLPSSLRREVANALELTRDDAALETELAAAISLPVRPHEVLEKYCDVCTRVVGDAILHLTGASMESTLLDALIHDIHDRLAAISTNAAKNDDREDDIAKTSEGLRVTLRPNGIGFEFVASTDDHPSVRHAKAVGPYDCQRFEI